MATASPTPSSLTPSSLTPPIGFTTLSRTIVSLAADVAIELQRAVVGPAKVRTARDNAWDAIQADRARAQARADTSRAVAALVAATAAPSRRRTKPLVTHR